MLEDLLESMFLAGARRRADAATATVESYLRNRVASEEEDREFEAKMAPGGALYDRVVAFQRAREPKPLPRRVRSVRGAPKKTGAT